MFTPIHRQVCLVALLMLWSVRLATAQTSDPRGTAPIHVGPLYATPALAIQEFGVDTNVFNSADRKSDFTFTIVPRATMWVPFARRALLTTAVGTDVVYYQTYQSERSLNPQIRVRGDGSFGRILPFAEGVYLDTRQRPNFEIDARSRRTEQRARLGTSVRISQKLLVEAAGSRSKVAFAADAVYNDVNLRDTLNRTTSIASLTVRHELTPLTTILVRTEGGNDRFQYSPLRDADTVRVMPGVEFKPRALVSGNASVGMRRFAPRSSSLASFTGVVANATLNYTLKGSTRFTVSADRDLTYSYERLQPYFVVGGYGLTVRRQIVGRTDLVASAERQQYTYRDLVLPGATLADLHRVDLTRTWSATIGYRFRQSTRLGFGAFYRERDSNSSRFRNYNGFRFATTLDYGL